MKNKAELFNEMCMLKISLPGQEYELKKDFKAMADKVFRYIKDKEKLEYLENILQMVTD